ARRQLGHGRGGRMKIERDAAEVTSGVRHGRTLGGPIALLVANRDYANWEERMNPWPVENPVPEVHLPRPGHADLAGVQKFGFTDVRNVLERGGGRGDGGRVVVAEVVVNCNALNVQSGSRKRLHDSLVRRDWSESISRGNTCSVAQA